MDMKRIAVLGYGSSGARHVSLLLNRFPKADFLVLSRRPSGDPRFATTSALADITRFCPEIAVVAGVATERLAMVRALPPAVRGIFIEKPLATSYDEGVQLADELTRRTALTRLGYNLRFSPSLREFRGRFTDGHLGNLVGVRVETGQYLPDWRKNRDYKATASAQKATGGGVLLELSHEIDYLRWIFGEIESVSAWIGRQSSLDIDVEDTAHLTVGFARTTSEVRPMGQVSLDFVRHDRTRRLTAICEGGSLRWDGISSRVDVQSEGSASWRTVFAERSRGPTTYELQCDSFLSALSNDGEDGASLHDGLSVLKIVGAARASHLSDGERMPVDMSANRL